MEASLCSQGDGVGLYFVEPSDGSPSALLLCAHQACEEKFKSEWVSQQDCLQMTPSKQDVFVCDPFEGDAFQHLISGFKCVVVGPRCILSCLHHTRAIPELPSPIHNTAMEGLIITTTGFDKSKKEEIQRQVERMSGIYSNNYHQAVTHVVASVVCSKKYQVAVEKGTPVMTGAWVAAVWQAVTGDDTSDFCATDECFLTHTCPVLHGLVVCVSQLDRSTKEALKGLIEENGGTYSSSLDMKETSVLIVSAPEGEKFTYACSWKIPCLSPDWIYDSVQQGHALEMDNYEVKRRKTSTPTRSLSTSMMPPDISMCSTIMNDSQLPRSTVVINETVDMDETRISINSGPVEVNKGIEAVESLDLQKALKAGLFLDGCKVFLSGFNSAHLEKLRRVLIAGGATRVTQLSEAVTHVVLGKPEEEHLSVMQRWSTRPHIVFASWITESIRLRSPAEEAQFTYQPEGRSEHPPPAPPTHLPAAPGNTTNSTAPDMSVTHLEDEVLRQCAARADISGNDSAHDMSTLPDSQDSELPTIFSNRTFTVSGYSQEIHEEIVDMIESNGGQVVPENHQGQVHYSLITASGQCHPQAREVVSHYFLEECIDSGKLLAVEYYHIPLELSGDSYPLVDCCVTISTYAKKERLFLETLATHLGAQTQELFSKKANASKNILASTHLVCPLPKGNKYQAAAKWGLPAVTCDWLIECARTSRKVPEQTFLVGQEDHPVLPRKKIFRDIMDAAVSRRGMEEKVESLGEEEEVNVIAATPVIAKKKGLRPPPLPFPSPACTPDWEALRNKYPTPGVTRSSDQAAALESMPTPDTPYGSTWYANPPPHVRKRFKRLIDSLPSPQPPAKPAPETPTGKLLQAFCADLRETVQSYKRRPALHHNTEEMDLREEEEVEEEEEEDSEAPLAGVVLCVARKFQEQREEMARTVEQLGGQCLHTYGPEVTHFLFQGRPNDLSKDFRRARVDKKIIVAPDWLWMCREEGTRVDEELFPYTHNPKKTLSLVGGRCSPAKRKPHGKRFPAHQEEESHQQQQEVQEEVEEDKEEEKDAISKQLREIANLSGKKGGETGGRSRPLGELRRHSPPKQYPDLETQPVSVEESESQGPAITWDDSQERQARLNLQDRLTEDTQDASPRSRQVHVEEESEEEDNKENVPSESMNDKMAKSSTLTPVALQPMFVLVGMTDDDKRQYTWVVERLGGTVSRSQTLNPQVTHIVAQTLKSSERTLMAIAWGKWVLTDSYLDHSQQAGRFLKEEMYAWGNPAAQHVPELEPDSATEQLAKGAWRWRCTVAGPAGSQVGRPFQYMAALIHTSKERIGSFARLIKAGGGEVLTGRPPYSDVEGVTHFFIDMDRTNDKIDLASFASQDIPCLRLMFIKDYLILDPPPEEKDYYLPQYSDILANMSSRNLKTLRRSYRQ